MSGAVVGQTSDDRGRHERRRDERRRDERRRGIRVSQALIGSIGFVVLLVLAVRERHAVAEAAHAAGWQMVGLVGLGALTWWVRAWAWRAAVDPTLPADPVHEAIAAGNVVGVVNPYAGSVAKWHVLRRRLHTEHGRPLMGYGHLASAEAVILVWDAVLTTLLLLPVALIIGWQWWIGVLMLGAPSAWAFLWYAQRRGWVTAQGMRGSSAKTVGGGVAVVFALSIARTTWACELAGLPVDGRALAVFVLTGVLGIVPGVGVAGAAGAVVLVYGSDSGEVGAVLATMLVVTSVAGAAIHGIVALTHAHLRSRHPSLRHRRDHRRLDRRRRPRPR